MLPIKNVLYLFLYVLMILFIIFYHKNALISHECSCKLAVLSNFFYTFV